MKLNGKTILVLGLGESGLAMARWCAGEGAALRVADTRSAENGGPPQLSRLKALLPEADIHLGGMPLDLLDGIDLIAISPGLSPINAPQCELLTAASARQIPVWGEIEFFAQKLAALKLEQNYAPRVLAITGTNGKTTVTSLVGKLCQRAGLKTRVAGNISPAALDALGDALANNALPQVWVLELSSFQLATTYSLAPDAATVLNVTQDHLDWHGDMEAYASAKARIFAATTVKIVNRDDARTLAIAELALGEVHDLKKDLKIQNHAPIEIVSFGIDAPTEAGQFGVVQEGGMRWLAVLESHQDEEGQTLSNRQKKLKQNQATEPGLLKRLMPAEALQIHGDHNIANALAALALCRAIDLPMAPLLHALRDYRGEAHRVELVMTLDDVDYIDDSKGTNVGATVAALNGLGNGSNQQGGRIILIAGGDGKGQDFAPLALPVAKHARAVVLIGKDAPAIRSALQACAIPLTNCSDLRAAVHTASALALPGDIVLLSPACASLDMFRDYKHRADVFINTVTELALEADAEAKATC